MPKGKELTDIQKAKMYTLSTQVREKHSNREIAHILGISEGSVRGNLKKLRETGSMENKPRSGRPPAMTPTQEKYLVEMRKRSLHKSATELCRDIHASTGQVFSVSTIKRYLAKNNLSAHQVRKMPLPEPRNIKEDTKHQLARECDYLAPYVCKYCRRNYNNRSRYRSHTRHHETRIHPYWYDDYKAVQKRYITSHRPSDINNNEKRFQCEYCTKRFTRSIDKIKHETNQTKEKRYKCSYCHKSFSAACRRKLHERIHPNKKPIQCEYCEKRFTQLGNKKVHERIHEKPYPCYYCNESFSVRSAKTVHERTHTNEKPIQCQYCKMTFIQSCDKIIHESLHSKVNPYQCRYCNMGFPAAKRRNLHERIHTTEKSLFHEYSNKKSIQSCYKTIHKSLHTIDKPFQCRYCNTSFPAARQRNLHERSHNKEKPFHCLYCGKGFLKSGNRNAHERIHAKE